MDLQRFQVKLNSFHTHVVFIFVGGLWSFQVSINKLKFDQAAMGYLRGNGDGHLIACHGVTFLCFEVLQVVTVVYYQTILYKSIGKVKFFEN